MESQMRKLRSSARSKKLSSSMRIVDEETRKIVQQNRIDALEADNIFDNNFKEEGDDSEGFDDYKEDPNDVMDDDHEIEDDVF
jgi:hypothetical protein